MRARESKVDASRRIVVRNGIITGASGDIIRIVSLSLSLSLSFLFQSFPARARVAHLLRASIPTPTNRLRVSVGFLVLSPAHKMCHIVDSAIVGTTEPLNR